MDTKCICEMGETITSIVKSELAKGVECIDTHELGEAIDMIKDLAEAEKYCLESKYYKAVTKAMHERSEDEDYDEDTEMMGYNHRHYPSGRFAPSGRGRVMGYNPIMHQAPYVDAYLNDPHFRENMSYGYSETDADMPMNRSRTESRYGKSYRDYAAARRHYTETNNPSDKEAMSMHANEHIVDTISTMRDIWKHADADMKARMKTDLQNLINEMK